MAQVSSWKGTTSQQGSKIGFKTVQLFQDQILGIGAYGKVCKARCDDLLCAAKIIHPTLFDPIEHRQQIGHKREHRLPIKRFEQECEFMSAIRHPNIVQFLGIIQESDTHLPVILMELMDESLTQFLKSSTQPIPYHIQVNICHDIALALSFLHSNNIVHRDLSSNNILLIGDIRAKVTDFGMARLNQRNTQSTCVTFTLCPGTDVYMPPEAIQDKPVYTDKIDCFSFGVLTVQILTLQFPKPGDRLKGIDMSLPGVSRGKVMMCVSEIDRRQSHISMVEPSHPLLSVSLDCLQDNDFDRPSAQQLCEKVSALKESAKYKESVQSVQDSKNTVELERKEHELKSVKQQYAQYVENFQQTILSQKSCLEEANQRIEQQDQIIQQKDQVIERQSQAIEQKEKIISDSLQDKEREISLKDDEILRLKGQLRQAMTQETIKASTQALAQNEFQQTVEQKDAVIVSRKHDIQELRKQLEQTQAQVGQEMHARKEIEKQLEMSEEFLAKFQKRISELEKQLQVQRQTTAQQQLVQKLQQQPQKSPLYHQPQAARRVESRRRGINLRWRKGSVAPLTMDRGPDAIVSGNHVYFVASKLSGGEPILHYDVAKNSWFQIAGYPYCMNGCSLAVLNNFLTGIGGKGDNGYTNKLMSLKVEQGAIKWMEHFPPMPTKRARASVLVSGAYLIVIGGQDANGPLIVTEVMNIETQQWFTSIPLPGPMTKASTTICGDQVYMLGGEEGYSSSKSVYTCPLSALLKHSQPKSLPAHLAGVSLTTQGNNTWSTIASLPVVNSTGISIQGHLLAIGGEESNNKSTTAIHTYDSASNSWTLSNHLITARTRCFAAVLPNNQLMVVGGWTKRALLLFTIATDDVEFGTVIAG